MEMELQFSLDQEIMLENSNMKLSVDKLESIYPFLCLYLCSPLLEAKIVSGEYLISMEKEQSSSILNGKQLLQDGRKKAMKLKNSKLISQP